MYDLKIKINEKEKTIKADESPYPGIFVVIDSKNARNNCEKLEINFDTVPDNVVQNRVSKIGNWSFLSTCVANSEFIQYIFTPTCTLQDFQKFVKVYDEPELKNLPELLTQAYNLLKLKPGNLDLFDKLSDSRN